MVIVLIKNKENIDLKNKNCSFKKYAINVLEEKILSCKWVKLACKRFLDDLDSDLIFDNDEVKRVVRFFRNLPHVKGEWAGQPIKLELWQEFVIANIFGWKKKDGTRRFKEVYLEVARKNGKSLLMAGIGLYLLGSDNEPGSEVYSCATTRDQAKIVFDIAHQMVKRSEFKKYINIFKNNLNIESSASKFEPLSSDYNSLDGLNIHGGLIDELHAHKTRDLYDIIKTAIGARRQPLIVTITTAGYDRHSICWEQHAYTEKVLEGVYKDDSFFGIIYTIDEKDDWEDEEIWIKSNPNLNVSVKLLDLQEKAQRAKEIPSQLNSFLRKHLDVWTESVTRWLSTERWDMCGKDVIDENDLSGRTCYGGLDLSSTQDITAWVLVFPPVLNKERYKVLCKFFIPQENMTERVRRDRIPYDVWVRQGFIYATPGNIVDYAFVLSQIDEDTKKFDLQELAFDRWGATKIIQDLQNLGFERPQDNKHTARKLIDFGQGYASMSAPTKELEKMVLGQEIEHGGNPVLRWMASNVVIRTDPAGNIKVDKGQSIEKVDGIVALVMAIDRAVRHEPIGEPSIFVL